MFLPWIWPFRRSAPGMQFPQRQAGGQSCLPTTSGPGARRLQYPATTPPEHQQVVHGRGDDDAERDVQAGQSDYRVEPVRIGNVKHHRQRNEGSQGKGGHTVVSAGRRPAPLPHQRCRGSAVLQWFQISGHENPAEGPRCGDDADEDHRTDKRARGLHQRTHHDRHDDARQIG